MMRSPALLTLLLSACGVLPPQPVEPLLPAASQAFLEARRLGREGRPEEALASARRAASLAPGWIAPRRFLDDAARDLVRTQRVVAGYRRELEARPEDPAKLYLLGRLEGRLGQGRLEAARRLDPRCGWIRHGLGWNAHLRGDTASARHHARQAVALARGAYERTYFTWALARIEVAADEQDRALRLLAGLVADPDTPEEDRTWLEVSLAELELRSSDSERRQRGAHRAIHLLGSARLLPAEVTSLVDRAMVFGRPEPGHSALHLALAGVDDPVRLLERGRLLHLEGPSALALELLGEGAGSPSLRVLRFAHGDPAREVEAWTRSLPDLALEGGYPRDARLAALLQAARRLGPPAGWDREGVARFGGALLAAGWFEEARALAGRVPAGDLPHALELDARARAGQGVIDRLVRLGGDFDAGRARLAPDVSAPGASDEGEGQALDDLDGLLEACAPALARAATQLGGPTEVQPWARSLSLSPRIDYGVAGQVLHPGPAFSALDEAQGLGEAGQPVEGLASVLSDLGRFGLFGQGLGQAPDGALLRRVLVEPRSGVHLGVPWQGTVAWCDGADLAPRAERLGARIAGAALHEGYWIDLEALRSERAGWARLYARLGEGLEETLAVSAVSVGPGEDASGIQLLLGAADLMRLAIMRDRGGAPSLDEFCQVTAVHEEGHLCDRTRFYPLGRNWLQVIGLLASAGFSPEVLARRLEERAQLVALCEVDDARLPLVHLLQAAEDGGGGVTAHAAAYANLCREFLAELDRQVQEEPSRFEAIERTAFLGQQAHRLTSDQVRTVAYQLALRRGLVLSGVVSRD